MQVRGDWTSLISWRALSQANLATNRVMGRLSSGLRINSAADDAAGLAISQTILGQVKGLAAANRNALDGLSLLNVAEGALIEVHELLQRGREIAIRTQNDSLNYTDKQFGQDEVDNILSEIDRIAATTSYNGRNLLNPSGSSTAMTTVIQGMRSGWLEQAEQLVNTHYGLLGDGSALQIVFDTTGPMSSWVTGVGGVNGRLDNVQLHINLSSFGTLSGPDGGTGPVYNDRKVAYALTRAILARSVDYVSLPEWFKSGVADFLAGRDEQLQIDATAYGLANLISAIDTWSDDDLHRSAAYLAIKYLASLLNPLTMVDVMNDLKNNDLNTALLNTLGIDTNTFLNDFKANGVAFFSTLNLSDADVGAIGGGDASSVIPNGGTYSTNPLTSFAISWPSAINGATTDVQLHVGANADEYFSISIPEVSRWSLNLIGIDLINRGGAAISAFNAAISTVASVRTYLGSNAERLEHVINSNQAKHEFQTNSLSRISDADFASEMVQFVRNQILTTSATAMMGQANTARQHVMWLLKDLRAPPQTLPQIRLPPLLST